MVVVCGWKKVLPLLFAAVLGIGCEGKSSGPSDTAPSAVASAAVSNAPATITVRTATYGAACGVPAGNRTEIVARECNGKRECTFVVSNKEGDPKPGCFKDFHVEYACGTGPAQQADHPAVQNENYGVDLTCK